MLKVEVTVSGPGGTIHNQMMIIEQALKGAGYPVTVVNEYPEDEHIIRPASPGWQITLVARHLPWGG